MWVSIAGEFPSDIGDDDLFVGRVVAYQGSVLINHDINAARRMDPFVIKGVNDVAEYGDAGFRVVQFGFKATVLL